VKYDRQLLEKAEAFAKDGQISYPDAKHLWDEATDDSVVTACEKLTLKYTLQHLKYTDKAAKFMHECLANGEAGRAGKLFKQIGGVKYDRQLLEKAEAFAKDGQISYPDAKHLWDEATDDSVVTACEKLTLKYTLHHLKYTDKAAKFLNEMLAGGANAPRGKSYYKHVGGRRYDREILETAEECAKDGRVSLDDAKKLWEGAQDGKGVTEIERESLLYVLDTVACTDEAKSFLSAQLSAQ